MLMFVWVLKLEKILKIDGAPEEYSVSSVRRVVRITPGTCLKEEEEKKRKTDILVKWYWLYLRDAVAK